MQLEPRKPRLTEENFRISEADKPLLAKMTEKHRSVLLIDGNFRERSEKLNIPVGTLKSRTNRARKRLMKLRQEAENA